MSDYFQKFGKLDDVRIIYDKVENCPRGFGFILFNDRVSAIKVFEKGEIHEVNGYNIECRPTLLREELQQCKDDESVQSASQTLPLPLQTQHQQAFHSYGHPLPQVMDFREQVHFGSLQQQLPVPLINQYSNCQPSQPGFFDASNFVLEPPTDRNRAKSGIEKVVSSLFDDEDEELEMLSKENDKCTRSMAAGRFNKSPEQDKQSALTMSTNESRQGIGKIVRSLRTTSDSFNLFSTDQNEFILPVQRKDVISKRQEVLAGKKRAPGQSSRFRANPNFGRKN